jgi:hypothetical protein
VEEFLRAREALLAQTQDPGELEATRLERALLAELLEKLR